MSVLFEPGRCHNAVGGTPPDSEGDFLLPPGKGGGTMITWEQFLAFCMFVVALIALVKQDR